jgi:hypothetical protein
LMSFIRGKLKNVGEELVDDGKSDHSSVEEKIITTDMLDEKIRRLKNLITSRNCLLPNTVDAQMQESDEFFNLVTKFLDQKILLARKCIQISCFIEDIHSLVALAITPAITLVLFGFVTALSKDVSSACLLPSFLHFLPQELKPFTFCCLPLITYLLYIYLVIKRCEGNTQTPGGDVDIEVLISNVSPKLRELVDLFHNSARRKKLLSWVWTLTLFFGIWLVGIGNAREIILRLCGLLMIVGINLIVGLSLKTLPTFKKTLHEFYTPLERNIRIISFSPILNAVLTSFGTLFVVPIFSVQLDYNELRELGIRIIALTQKKFTEVLAVQEGMRNVRELLKVTTHVQDLAQSLVSLEVDREAGRALVNEVPKAASKLFWWASETVRKHFDPSPVRRR